MNDRHQTDQTLMKSYGSRHHHHWHGHGHYGEQHNKATYIITKPHMKLPPQASLKMHHNCDVWHSWASLW